MLENLGTANMAFTLLPLLTLGAVEAIDHHGSAEHKALYPPRLASGEWSGTMNLTGPKAGSDVGALRASAEPVTEGEHAGKYSIKGTKTFITWGEQNLLAISSISCSSGCAVRPRDRAGFRFSSYPSTTSAPMAA